MSTKAHRRRVAYLERRARREDEATQGRCPHRTLGHCLLASPDEPRRCVVMSVDCEYRVEERVRRDG